jgi:hypothetical protein
MTITKNGTADHCHFSQSKPKSLTSSVAENVGECPLWSCPWRLGCIRHQTLLSLARPDPGCDHGKRLLACLVLRRSYPIFILSLPSASSCCPILSSSSFHTSHPTWSRQSNEKTLQILRRRSIRKDHRPLDALDRKLKMSIQDSGSRKTRPTTTQRHIQTRLERFSSHLDQTTKTTLVTGARRKSGILPALLVR